MITFSLLPARNVAFGPSPLLAHLKYFSVFYFAHICAWLTVFVYFPGYMSEDSVAQLGQARFGVNSNVYPPLMNYVWSAADRIIPGPAGMLILHNLVFWHALALISHIVIRSTRWRFIFIGLAGFWPPTYGSLGTIWKDVGMQVFLLSAVAFMLYSGYLRRIWPLGLSFLCLFLSGGYRHNAIAAGVPLVFLLATELTKLLCDQYPHLQRLIEQHSLFRSFRLGVAVLFTALLAAAVTFVGTFNVTDVKLWTSAFVYDLVGISVRQNVNYLPPYYNPGERIKVEDLKGIYSPLHANSLGDPGIRKALGVINPSSKSIQILVLSDSQARNLTQRWLTAVLDNLGSYLDHRLILAGNLLVVTPRRPWYPYVEGISPNPFGLIFRQSQLNKIVMRIIHFSAFETNLYSAWIYYLIVALCFCISFVWDFAHARTVQILFLSSFLYFISIFLFGMSGDFRYNIWMLTCSYICPALLLGGGRHKR